MLLHVFCLKLARRILQNGVRHISLHFDGVRERCLDPSTRLEDTAMKENLEEEVYSKAGYSVVVKRKFHFSFMEWVVKSSTHTKEKLVSREEELYKAGNCIPCAISNVDSAKRLKIIVAVTQHPPTQNSSDGNAVRMYEDWSPPKNPSFSSLCRRRLFQRATELT